MTEAATEKAAEQPKEKTPGVGDLAKEMIRAGKTNQETLAAIKEKFPEAKTSMASVNWYRNNLRSLGENVPMARALTAASREAEKAEKKAAKEAEKAAAKAKKDAEKAEKKAAKEAEKAAAKAAKDAAKAETKANDGANAKADEPSFMS